MKSILPKNLIELSNLLSKPIYVVGGAVRDFLIGSSISDIDLAGALTPDELTKELKDSLFRLDKASARLGTVIIHKDGEAYEYTTFRKDSYDMTGFHTPVSTSFVESIELDTFRRDFTINAIYYEISTGNFIDYSGGIGDIKKKTIRTTREAAKTFEEDALRILRAVRLSAELSFSISEETRVAAKSLVNTIDKISRERIADEFNKIILADVKHGFPQAHYNGIMMLDNIGVLEYIVPELIKTKGVEQKREYHSYDVFGHIMEVFKLSRADLVLRLVALLHDTGKAYVEQNASTMKGHEKISVEHARKFLNRFKYSNAVKKAVTSIIDVHMFNTKANESEVDMMHFIQDNYAYIDAIIEFKCVDKCGSGLECPMLASCHQLQQSLYKMKDEKLPFKVKDLCVDGKDLIELKVAETDRSKVLKDLLKETIRNHQLLDRERALEYIKSKTSIIGR